MTRASLLLAVLLAACGPKEPAGSGTTGEHTTGTTGSTGSTGDTSTAAPTTGEPTTGLETTGLETTGLETTGPASSSTGDEPPLCAWVQTGSLGFCPLLAMPNIAITGMTPMGEVTFQYAYFGLQLCSNCPQAGIPSVGLFAQEQSPGLDPLVGDRIILEGVQNGEVWAGYGEIGGVFFEFFEESVETFAVDFASDEQPTPLDPAAPPKMSGMVAISGEGWAIEGSFTATLCRTLDWSFPCE